MVENQNCQYNRPEFFIYQTATSTIIFTLEARRKKNQNSKKSNTGRHLKITKADENDVTSSNPDLFVHLSSDVAQPLCTIYAHRLAPPIPKHPQYLQSITNSKF